MGILLFTLCMARGSVEQAVPLRMSHAVPVQLVVNIVAVVTAAVGAVALQESPLTAVQMVCRTRLALWPFHASDLNQYSPDEGRACFPSRTVAFM